MTEMNENHCPYANPSSPLLNPPFDPLLLPNNPTSNIPPPASPSPVHMETAVGLVLINMTFGVDLEQADNSDIEHADLPLVPADNDNLDLIDLHGFPELERLAQYEYLGRNEPLF